MNDSLLSIDVEAELYKLSVGRLSSREQGPVALVRMAALLQASQVSLMLSKNKLKLEHDGEVPSWAVIYALQTLLDRSQSDRLRHEALESLEMSGMLDMLVALCMEARLVEVDLGAPISQRMRVMRGSRAAKFVPSSRKKGMCIEISGGARNVAEESSELANCLRYAGYRVELNGKRIDCGLRLEQVMFQTPFQYGPFWGVTGLPRQGLAAVTRMLRRGVLEKEVWLSPQDGLVWEAVVETPEGVSPKSVVEQIRKGVVELYARACREFNQLGQEEKQRVKQLLFRVADFGAGAKVVNGVKLFQTVKGEWIDAQSIVKLASDRIVRAVGINTAKDKYMLFGAELVLDEQDRGFIERHLGLVVREPPRQPNLRFFNTIFRGMEAARTGFIKFLARMTVGRALPEDSLSLPEKRFLHALNRVLSSGMFLQGVVAEAVFSQRRLGIFKTVPGRNGARRMILFRKNPKVNAMVRAFESDPKSLYASLMLLADGRVPFAESSSQVLAMLSEFDRQAKNV